MKARGFSLLECLIGLTISFFVICACLGFFVGAEKSFFKLRDKEEAAQNALAALDKMRVDILRAGQGLAGAAAAGLVEPVVEVDHGLDDGGLLVTRAEKSYVLAADVAPGDSRVALESIADLKPGREVLIFDGGSGEVRTISSVARGVAEVSPAIEGAYAKETASLLLLERIGLALDSRQGVIRRRVNSSSAQPLLENAGSARFAVDRPANLVRVHFSLASEGDADYELCLFPKNPALSGKG